jgi:hypothetical protein
MNKKTSPLSDAIIEEDEEENDDVAEVTKSNRRKSRKKNMRKRNGTTTFRARLDDLTSLQLMNRLAWPIVIGMLLVMILSLCLPYFLQTFTVPAAAVLMGMWIIWFVAATTDTGVTMAKWLILADIIFIAFVVCAVCPWPSTRIPFIVLAVMSVLVQIIMLMCMLCACPKAETQVQRSFYGAVKGVCIVVAHASFVFIYKSFLDWPSTKSFYSAVAGMLCFAYASLLAAVVTGTRGKCEDPVTITCQAASSCMDRVCCTALLPTLLNVVTIAAFALLWPPPKYLDAHIWIVGAVYPSALGALALVYHSQLMKARRIHVRLDGSVLVETLSKTYVYDKAIHVFLEPMGGVLPKQTATCHVYCDRSTVPVVVVELTKGRLLCLTPDLPTEFKHAVTHAIEHRLT